MWWSWLLCSTGKIILINSNIAYIIISIINIYFGFGLLIWVFTDTLEFFSPYFKWEMKDELILFTKSIINVAAVNQIAVGLFIFSIVEIKTK